MIRLLPAQALVEMLIAIAVITVALVAMVGLATKSVSNATFTKNQSLALNIATQTIECVRKNRQLYSWAVFRDSPTTGCPTAPPPPEFSLVTNPTLSAGPPEKMTMEVIVGWEDNKGTHQSVQTTEFIDY